MLNTIINVLKSYCYKPKVQKILNRMKNYIQSLEGRVIGTEKQIAYMGLLTSEYSQNRHYSKLCSLLVKIIEFKTREVLLYNTWIEGHRTTNSMSRRIITIAESDTIFN